MIFVYLTSIIRPLGTSHDVVSFFCSWCSSAFVPGQKGKWTRSIHSRKHKQLPGMKVWTMNVFFSVSMLVLFCRYVYIVSSEVDMFDAHVGITDLLSIHTSVLFFLSELSAFKKE